MTQSYDASFVILSVVVAILASFAALELAGRVRSESGAARIGWLAGGGAVMGLGIWSMHFVGMLAFHLPVPIGYDLPLMLLSVVVAIAASFLALIVISRPELGPRTLLPAGILMGAAIAGMHYIGMASMRVEASRSYSASIVALSVLIAIVASLVALWLAFRFRSDLSGRGALLKVSGAVIMGVAISGMHYTGMAAARFAPGGSFASSDRFVLASGELGQAVVETTMLLIILVLIGAAIDRGIQARASFARRLSEQTSRLRKSEQQYRVLFDDNPNPMWVYARSTLEFLAVNEAAVRRYGYTRGEFLAMSHDDIRVKPEPRPPEGVTIPGESAGVDGSWNGQHRKKNGTLIDVAVTSHTIGFDGREACLALPMDVTDRRRAEEALRQSEQRTRLIIDTALDAVIAMRSSGVISDWSAHAERMFGWSRAEAVGQQMSDLIIPPRYRDAHHRGLKKFLQTGEGPVLNKRIEITALSRDGREFPIELAISPARLGEEWTFSAFIRDLTERKKSEEALMLGERRYRELFEDVPVGIYRSTPEGRLVDVNPAMVSMLGYPDRESLLATPAPSLYVDPEDRVRWTTQMTGEGVVLDFDVRMRRADGAVIWARDTTHVKRAPDGTALLYEGVLEDITERRLLESQLSQTSKMEAVGQLAGGVAHDFNNLLTVIMSYGAMLLDRGDMSDSIREDVREITAAADRAAGLTRQLLAFSRQQVMQPRVMNINAVIGDIEKMLRRLIGEDVELQISLDPGIATINADSGQLEQVLVNLVVNACHAMPAGGRLSISTSNSQLSSETGGGTMRAPDGDYVMLAVSDTGTGMTAEVQQRLFDPFFTTKDLGRGTGLGLSTVYGIVKQSDGEIYVYSELGQGSTFKIYFPRFTSSVEPPPDDVKPKAVPRGEESVLVVEDDSNLRGLAARVLRNCGYTVYVAGGGAEALTIALDPKTLIDAVITDVVMPGMNGRELVERLIESRPGMRSLLMSGYTDDDILRRGVLHGETAFLQKPFTPEQLARKVRGVLDRS